MLAALPVPALSYVLAPARLGVRGLRPTVTRQPAVAQDYPAGSIVYVDADATGANNGASWTDAFVSLQGIPAGSHC